MIRLTSGADLERCDQRHDPGDIRGCSDGPRVTPEAVWQVIAGGWRHNCASSRRPDYPPAGKLWLQLPSMTAGGRAASM
jgi:hypothetical protein